MKIVGSMTSRLNDPHVLGLYHTKSESESIKDLNSKFKLDLFKRHYMEIFGLD